jgi:hypothetical protein
VDGDLAQADPAERAGVLAGGACRVGGGLLLAGLVPDQHRVFVGELAWRPGGLSGPGRRVVVPHRASQDVL